MCMCASTWGGGVRGISASYADFTDTAGFVCVCTCKSACMHANVCVCACVCLREYAISSASACVCAGVRVCRPQHLAGG